MSRVVATVGAIPGAGATTVVAGLGAALAEQRHHVALVDASAEGSRIANVLSLDGDGTVADALRRRADLADVQASGPHGLSAFPADPETNWSAIRPGAVASTYGTLRDRFEIVLVDCGSAITPASTAWLGHADELVVVTDPDVPEAVQDVAGIGGAFDVPVLGLVANRVVRDELSAARSALESTGESILAVLPEDPAVGAAAEQRRSLLMDAPDSPIASCLWELGRRLSDGDHATPVVPEPWSDRAGVGASATSSDGGAGATNGTGAGGSGPAGSDGGTEAAVGSDTSATTGAESSTTGADTPTGTGADTSTATGADTSTATGSTTPSSAGSSAGSADASTGSSGAADGSAAAGSSSASTTGSTSSTGGASTSAGSAGAGDAASTDEAAPTDDADDSFEFSDPDEDGIGVGGDASATPPPSDPTDAGATGDPGGDPGGGAAGGAGAADTDRGDDEATISDDEIEEVFKETMQRVKDEKDAESDDEDDDSVLGGFMSD